MAVTTRCLAAGVEKQIDESGARDLRFGQQGRRRQRAHQCLSDVARIALERLGELQSQIAGVVAMSGLLGPLQRDGGAMLLGKRFGDGARKQLRDMASEIGGRS